MSDRFSHTEHLILDGLMSLYNARSDDVDASSPELLPIFSGLKPERMQYTEMVLLARGGMKTVMKVFDPKTARYVALAKLNPDSPDELYEPFLREARLTALLDHPNIITVYDIGLSNDSAPYFTMELKSGQHLDQMIDNCFAENVPQTTRPTLGDLLSIFLKICDAMDYAHSQQVIHLDLKPKNIQLGRHGEVIVCDWGLGKLVGNKNYDGGEFDRLLLNPDLLNNMTLSGHIKGTPGFMAPEQVQSDGEKTCRTDIYALGALLYDMLTHHTPVEGDTTDELLTNTRKGNIICPIKRFPHLAISPALSAITMKALAIDPADRYESVRALSKDITQYLGGYSTSAETTGIIKETQLFCQRNRLAVNLSGLFLFLLFTSITAAFISIHKSERAAVNALQQLQQEKQERERLGREAAPSFHARALVALAAGNIDEAFHLCQTASVLDSEHEEARNLLASLCFIQGDYAQAERTFNSHPQSLYRMIWNLNHGLLEHTLTPEQEYAEVKTLLQQCGTIIPTPLSTALFLHWTYDQRPAYRELALRYLTLSKEMCAGVLAYASGQENPIATATLVTRVLETLSTNPSWSGRRIPASRGQQLSRNPLEQDQFQQLIPANLALGQPVVSKGIDKTEPSLATDGIMDTYWAAGSMPSHVSIDLGEVHLISNVKVVTNQFAQQDDKFRITLRISSDGQTFSDRVELTTRVNEPPIGIVHEFIFPPTAARYIRVKVIFHSGITPIQIRDIQVY